MKIFVTVGAQMPFDRLITTIDQWAADHPHVEVFAQTGNSNYLCKNIASTRLIPPDEFKQRIVWADLLLAHAGMGSILTALQYGKPALVMPRRGHLKETRNDHQVDTAIKIRSMTNVAVAMDEDELLEMLGKIDVITANEQISANASDQLLDTVRQFIHVAG